MRTYNKKFGTNELTLAGQALFGDRWQTDLSRALGLSDARRIRQWLTGDRPIPTGVWNDIAELLKKRHVFINEVLMKLEEE